MEQTKQAHNWLKSIITFAILGFILNFPGMRGGSLVHAQAIRSQTFSDGFNWEYQVDFNAPSSLNAKQQAASLTPSLKSQGVASNLQSLGDSMYQLQMTGDQGMQQVRQTLFSPLLAGFINGPAEVEIDMPIGSSLDSTFKLESNPSTGFGWEVIPLKSIGFAQAGEPTFAIRSRGFGVPSVETLVMHPIISGNGIVKLVYRRPFEPNETITRHLHITLGTQALEIDLTNPHPQTISSQAGSSPSHATMNPIDEIPLKGKLPSSWDWRTYGIVPAPRNQGNCGSCWAFGTVGIMESAIAKAGGPLTDLSEQFLVSCNTSGWNCTGGLTAHMYHYDRLGLNQTAIGAVLEADKPYTATNGTCTVAYNHPYILSGWQFIVATEFTMPTVEQIKNAIYTYGPVTAGVCADNGWSGYSGGIYSPLSNKCSGETNHQIILVGWDDASSSWILRNSWGSSWGESGYMRISWDTTGTTSRVGEGTSWVTWGGATPAPFSKSSPAYASVGWHDNPVLSWETSSGAASYEYCIDSSSNNTCDTSWISTGTSLSVNLSGLASGTHFWQVRAIDTDGTTYANAGTWWSFTVGQVSQIYVPLFFQDFSGLGHGIVNGDFESGSNGWTEYSSNGYKIIVSVFSTGVTARSGSYAAWMGGIYNETNSVQQQVTISASAPYLVYWHWIASADYCGFDYGRILVNGSIVDSYDLCKSNNTGGWVKHNVDLSAYAGQTITLQIRAETDNTMNSNLFIDDVSLQASAALSRQNDSFVPNPNASSTQDKIGIVKQEK